MNNNLQMHISVELKVLSGNKSTAVALRLPHEVDGFILFSLPIWRSPGHQDCVLQQGFSLDQRGALWGMSEWQPYPPDEFA